MTPQERQMLDELFDRLSKLENAPRDPDAAAVISQGLRKAPNAVYALTQTVLLQDEALRRASAHIQELEAAQAPQPSQPGGFLDSMRETLFGSGQSHGSVPNVRPPESKPVWNSGQVMQQMQPPGYDQPPYGQPPSNQGPFNQGPFNQGYGAPPTGGGGSFLGTAAASAAGLIGGSLLLNSIRNMMGGSQHGFGDATGLGNRGGGDQSGSNLARDAGLDNIGSGQRSNQGMFNQASNDAQMDQDYDDDEDADAMDDDGSDFGGDDSGDDYA